MVLAAAAKDIVYTPAISGVDADFRRASPEKCGLDHGDLPDCGHGAGTIADVPGTAGLCARTKRKCRAAVEALAADLVA